MNLADDRPEARGIARGLADALAPVLADNAPSHALAVAREVAQVLGLEGLDRVLAECAPHAGRPWPAELSPALERLRRLAAHCAEAGSIGPLQAADAELAGLAGELAALEWSAPPPREEGAAPAVATLAVADALEDLPLAGDEATARARDTRLTGPVAAALRAALDWLAGEGGPGRPLALRAADSLLEARCERVDHRGIPAATEVLAAVEGSLTAGPGGWTVRVPAWSAHESFLMIEQAGVPLAVPWHAVLRLRMAAPGEVASRARNSGVPLVASPAGIAPAGPGAERPVLLVAHGRKRAWVVADRLVWRLGAAPAPAPGPAPLAGLTRAVRTDEDALYWVAEPGWLLLDVEAPPLPEPSAAPAPPAAASALPPAAAAPLAAGPAPPPAPAPPAAAAPALPPAAPLAPALPPAALRPGMRMPAGPTLTLLTPADVEPIEPVAPAPPAAAQAVPRASAPRRAPLPAPPRPVAPGPPAPGHAAAPAVPGPLAGALAGHTALIAEDSITARIFLTRMLERAGFAVEAVDSAAALRAWLDRRRWSLVCVDAELPDASGPEFLRELAVRHGIHTPLVVLVRDADDVAVARDAGISRILRKPFDREALEALLARLGLAARGAP